MSNEYNPDFNYYEYDEETRELINKQNEVVSELESKYLNANEIAKAAKKAHESALAGLCELISDREDGRGKPVQGKFDFGQKNTVTDPDPETTPEADVPYIACKHEGQFEYNGNAEWGILRIADDMWTDVELKKVAMVVASDLCDPAHKDYKSLLEESLTWTWYPRKKEATENREEAIGDNWKDLPVAVLAGHGATENMCMKLANIGITTLGQLEVHSLEGIKGIGKTAAEKIRDALIKAKEEFNEIVTRNGSEDSGDGEASTIDGEDPVATPIEADESQSEEETE